MGKVELIFGDCLIENNKIESGSVDLILTDLPYGNIKIKPSTWVNSETSWDVAIDAKEIHLLANRILRPAGRMILFSMQPYTTKLISASISNVPFSYSMIWEKDNFANGLLCNESPVNYYEEILVFYKKYDCDYIHPLRKYFLQVLNFIGLNIKEINRKLNHRKCEHCFYIDTLQFSICTEKSYNDLINIFNINQLKTFKPYEEIKEIDKKFRSTFNLWEGKKVKSNILKYRKEYKARYHPTQKPVLLLEDLIKTYSNENDLVVDLTMGSGSTGVACRNTNRRFIGIEKDAKYFEIATKRIHETCLL